MSISRDGHTAVIQAGAARNSNDMVRAADALKGPLASTGSAAVSVNLTGASGMWSDFNHANKSAMLKSEVISWPVTMGILVLAFGSLVAAGLPLMLTILGLVAAAGSLYLGTQLLDISIWAMNFALMFALALGIDYALFVVMRFRGAFFGSGLSAEEATAVTMDTAGKAVLFSGLTVLISLTAVMLVPSPAFRSMSLGIMLVGDLRAGGHAHAAAGRARQARPQGGQALAAVGAFGRAPLGALRGLGRAPLAQPVAVRDRRGGGAGGPRAAGARPQDRHAVDQGGAGRATTRARATTRCSRRSAPGPPVRSRSWPRRATRARWLRSRSGTRASPR